MNKAANARLFFVLFSFSQIPIGYTQNKDSEKLIFDHLGVIEGLSQSWVLTTVQDADGYMWIGTRDGLNRYDARTFKVYRSSIYDSATLYSNHITTLLIDSKDRMWVGTIEGINLYNREKDKFIRIPILGGQGLHINDLFESKDGLIWIAAVEGLYQYNPDGGLAVELIFQSDQQNKIISGRMKTIFYDSQDNLWVDAKGGLIQLELTPGKQIIKSYVELPNDQAGAVRDIIEFPNGVLWIATDQDGIFSYHLETKKFEHLNETDGLISNYVKKLFPNPDANELWIGTRHGLSIYEFDKKSFKNIDKESQLADHSIHSIYKDKDGSFWLGTYGGGLKIYSESLFKIRTYKMLPDNQGLNNSNISAINEINSEEYLIGTEGGGINLYKNKTGKYQHFVHQINSKESLPLNNIKCIFKERDGTFWIGTSGKSVSNFNQENGTFRTYTYEEIGIKSDAWVYSITQDQNDILWFGIYEGGISWFNKKTSKYGLITSATQNSFFFAGIRTLKTDSKNRIWIGTDNGLSFYDQEKKIFRYIFDNTNEQSPVKRHAVYSIYEDSNHTIWIGTQGGGLIRYHEYSDTFKAYKVENGLPGNNIFGILEDKQRNLWLSTNRGVSKFDPVNESFQNYTIHDGFLDMEYNLNAYFKSSAGELFFGGSNGLVSFYPEDIKENTIIPQVVLTEIKLLNQVVIPGDRSGILKNQIGHTNQIILKYDQNVFTLDFAVLNFVKPAKNQYAYKLTGLEDDWNFVESPSATYMNLPPGNYTFQAMGANNDGYWNPDPVELSITILPAPWKTAWAYLGYTTILALAIFVFIRYQRIKVTLEHDLKFQEFENSRQEYLNQAKLKFFTDISHEIRTPLTLLISPLEDLIAEYRDQGKLYRKLHLMKNNTDRLLRLVNQLLDYRKKESGKFKLKAAEGNIVSFLTEITLAFHHESEKRKIDLRFSTDSEVINIYFDRNEMEKVFYNLVSNSFKYSPDSKTISIRVKANERMMVKNDGEINAVRIEVIDHGIGINSNDIDKIFERYYEADHASMNSLSTGIGLSLSKAIIKAHKGQISCKSSKDGEENITVFTVYLRYGKDHLNPDEIVNDYRNSEQIAEYEALFEPIAKEQPHTNNADTQDAALQTLLVVEDNEEIRSFLVSNLSRYFKVIDAPNGLEALEMAVKTIPDLIISDILMPKLNGVALCAHIKKDQRTSHIPVILLTARTSLIHKVEGIESGADDYITKPFNLELLKAKIKNLLESRAHLLSKFSKEITLQPENIIISDPDEKFLKKIKGIMDEHAHKPEFNVHHFMKEVGMSRTVLYRKIKAITNMSIIDLIVSYRLNKAAILLKNNNSNISEIAYQVGFSDPKYFSRAFRKKFGLNPKKYFYQKDHVEDSMPNEEVKVGN